MAAKMDRNALFRRQESIFSRQDSTHSGFDARFDNRMDPRFDPKPDFRMDPRLDNNCYLQPTAAEYDLNPNGPHNGTVVGPQHQQIPPTDQLRQKNGGFGRPGRFDSGVADMDGPAHRLSTVSSRQYEDIDNPNQYEELPTPRSSTAHMDRQLSQFSHTSQASHHSGSGGGGDLLPILPDGVQSDSDETVALSRSSEKRKRYNPIYEAAAESAPKLFSKYTKSKRMDMLERRVASQWIAIVILLIIMVVILALSIFLGIKFNEAIANRDGYWEKRLQNLEKGFQQTSIQNNLLMSILEESGLNVSTLENSNIVKTLQNSTAVVKMMDARLKALKSQIVMTHELLSGQLKAVNSSASRRLDVIDLTLGPQLQNASGTVSVMDSLSTLGDQLSRMYLNLSDQVSTLNTSTATRLDTISKMPGPPGVGNLTACFYRNQTSYIVASDKVASTVWKPEPQEVDKYVVMSASCSVEGGNFQTMETLVDNPHFVRYRCTCGGRLAEIYRKCTVHLWMCPRET